MDTDTLLAKMYARVRRELAQKGLLIDQPDLFIAATAIEHNLLLVTRNRKDFERIPDLKLYQYPSFHDRNQMLSVGLAPVESRYVMPGVLFQSLIKSYLAVATRCGSAAPTPRPCSF